MTTGPLADRTVVVTRPRSQATSLTERLEGHGAHVLEFPTIAIAPPEDATPLLRAAEAWEEFDWLVCTSVNGVAAVEDALRRAGRSPEEALGAIAAAAIGPATAHSLREAGAEVRVVPPAEYRAEALAESILREVGDPTGVRFLLPRAAGARRALPDRLREAGGDVVEIEAYRTSVANPDAEGMGRRLREGGVDWLTFTASSTVRNFVRLVDADPAAARAACIGPITAGTAREEGFRVEVVAEEYTVPGLVRALVDAETGTGRRAS